eukprot:1297870-Amphidinium_carterae.1
MVTCFQCQSQALSPCIATGVHRYLRDHLPGCQKRPWSGDIAQGLLYKVPLLRWLQSIWTTSVPHQTSQ